jgi:hypothetical protein
VKLSYIFVNTDTWKLFEKAKWNLATRAAFAASHPHRYSEPSIRIVTVSKPTRSQRFLHCAQKHEMWHLRFSQWYCWSCMSSGMSMWRLACCSRRFEGYVVFRNVGTTRLLTRRHIPVHVTLSHNTWLETRSVAFVIAINVTHGSSGKQVITRGLIVL